MDVQMLVTDGITACRKIREVEMSSKANTITLVMLITDSYGEKEKADCFRFVWENGSHSFTFNECKSTVQAIRD